MHFFRYRRYRGFIGAVMDFEMHPTYRLIASVGLGRTVVLHRMKQPGISLWRKYLKQKVCWILPCVVSVCDTKNAWSLCP